jgi:putative sterol carrier protein
VNPNVAVVLPMMCHEDEATAIERGIDGAHFFGFALAHYYGTSPHEPGRTSVWDDFVRHRETQGFSREIINADDAPLGVRIMQQGTGSLRGAIGTPAQVTELIRRYEAVGVDQMIFVLQAGPTKHEHIRESLELFGKQIIPRFAEGRDERERAKAERLAPAVEAALARRDPPRRQAPYRIDETAELARARAGRTSGTLPADLVAAGRTALRTRGRRAFARFVSARSDEELERRFGPAGQRVFFAAMARAFDPEMAMGFAGELEFRIRRAGEETTWTVRIAKNRAKAEPGPAKDAKVRIRAGAADFLRLVAGEAQPPALVLDGRLEIDGDIAFAPRIGEMFGGPSPY